MDSAKYFGELDLEKRKNRRLQWALTACVVIVLVQALTIKSQTGKDRFAFVPPEITRPFWISAEDASQEYFEQLAQFVGALPLNVTPETSSAACKQYLMYVLPKDHDKFKKRCTIEDARIKRDNVSQMFSVENISTDIKRRRVALVGTLSTFIGGKQVIRDKTAYLIEFVHSDGRFYIANQEKVPTDDLFNKKQPG